jgi:serine/threonine protein kinase
MFLPSALRFAMNERKFGPYQSVGVLGKGGMGTVFKAVHEVSGAHVAIKMLHAHESNDQYFRSRFESEIETLLKLQHPNIVRLLSYGEEEGEIYFAMELVDGSSLYDLQKHGRLFEWREVVDIAMQIAEGLKHAHDRGIVHRDIKPGNLLLTQANQLKITDFGIAKLFGGSQITLPGGIIGTVDFMSPEQAQGQLVTARSDLYSVGCVIYMLLARRVPWPAKNLSELLQNLQKPIRPLSAFASDVPYSLDKIVAKLLERDPAKRIGSAQALVNRLQELLDEVVKVADAPTCLSDDASFDFLEDQKTEGGKSSKAVQVNPTVPSRSRENKTASDELRPSLAPTIDDAGEGEYQLAGDEQKGRRQKATYYTEVAELRTAPTKTSIPASSVSGHIWPYVLGLLILFGVGVYGVIRVAMSEPTADELYQEISSSFDDPARLQTLSDQFVDRFPHDERSGELKQSVAKSNSDRYTKRLLLRLKLRGNSALSTIESEYVRAIQLRDIEPDRCLSILESVIATFTDVDDLNSDDLSCLAAINGIIEAVRQESSQYQVKQIASLKRSLESAVSKMGSDPEQAKNMLSGIVSLYRDRTWAKGLVAEAEGLLKSIP